MYSSIVSIFSARTRVTFKIKIDAILKARILYWECLIREKAAPLNAAFPDFRSIQIHQKRAPQPLPTSSTAQLPIRDQGCSLHT